MSGRCWACGEPFEGGRFCLQCGAPKEKPALKDVPVEKESKSKKEGKDKWRAA